MVIFPCIIHYSKYHLNIYQLQSKLQSELTFERTKYITLAAITVCKDAHVCSGCSMNATPR